MSRTRRGTLVLMAGSAAALVVDTLGFSAMEASRSVRVDVVEDENALLALTDDGEGGTVADSGILFDGECRDAPQLFDVENQLPQEIERLVLEIEGEEFRFLGEEEPKSPDETDVEFDDDELRLVVKELPPGEAVKDITITLPEIGAEETDTVKISAEGAGVHISADRELCLKTENGPAFLLCRGRSPNCVGVFLEFGSETPKKEVEVGSSDNETDDDSDNGTVETETVSVEKTTVDVTVRPTGDDGNGPVFNREVTLESGDDNDVTIKFDNSIDNTTFGGSGAGDWNVTATEPDTDLIETGPGEKVTVDFEDNDIRATLYPDDGPPGKLATLTLEKH